MNLHNLNIAVGWMILQSVIWLFLACMLSMFLGYTRPQESAIRQSNFCRAIFYYGSITTALLILAVKLIWFW
jgi:hypothetical protein